ncbi:MAG: DUF1688 family protein [Deltaproteobacteria bacterium]|nr:DUF1688 family protein [Deltaproteobacteria bacterium]
MTASALAYLRSPLAIRARCEAIFELAAEGRSEHFKVDLEALPVVVDEVVRVTREHYPELKIPVHGRINHFRAGGVDRVAALGAKISAILDVGPDHHAGDRHARAWIDLVVVSVLLDAGAGPTWRFHEPATGLEIGRSEGLAIASLHAFEAGLFSADPENPLRVDAAALRALDAAKLEAAFQSSAQNVLPAVDGRLGLVRALGEALLRSPRLFAGGRPSGLLDHFRMIAPQRQLPAAEILTTLLEGLSSIWPSRLTLDGKPLGDIWRHRGAGGSGPTEGLVPFHELSQWLAYSLFEPLERSGLTILQPDALTALPEYRNGGLLVDLGVLVPKHARARAIAHPPGDELIVEWRALTIAVLDRVAVGVRERLGLTALQLPLACVLEGTWGAGRAVAARLRPDGGPPIRIELDGTVF